MCGICGTAGFADEREIQSMMKAMVHRGPNDSGFKTFSRSDGRPWAGLGHQRLSIIDLSPRGHQPMTNEDSTLWLSYNGEVYNYLDLRPNLEAKGHVFRSKTDSEVLLHLYEEKGAEFLKDLNGIFSLAIWDDKLQQLLLARDPFGIKPLYYAILDHGRIAFASEIKSLLSAKIVKPEVNEEALHYYLNFLWVPGPRTMFKNIFKLMPGHYLIWRDGRFDIQKYSCLEPLSELKEADESNLAEELRSILVKAVQRQMVSDVPLGVFLSGGLDSSAILALATQARHRPMKAYTIVFRDQDRHYEQSSQDAKYARVVARTYGANHSEIEVAPNIVDLLPKVVWHLDEPIADPAAITSYLICQAASKNLTVLLSGQGGDEIFGGYRIHLEDILSGRLQWVPKLAQNGLLGFLRHLIPLWSGKSYFGISSGRIVAYYRYLDKLARGLGYSRESRYVFHRASYSKEDQWNIYSSNFLPQVEKCDAHLSLLSYFDDVRHSDFKNQMLYVDQKTYLTEGNLTYSDKTSMAHSVEVRVPLLDQEVVEFMRRVPGEMKIKNLKLKHLLKKSMQGILPREVLNRRKAGFSAPIRTWLRQDLKEMVSGSLSETMIKKRGYFNPKVVRELIKENEKGIEDHTYRIWALLTFEEWHRQFIDT